jgi:uncharacterized repeat protein (TIGR03803 family)
MDWRIPLRMVARPVALCLALAIVVPGQNAPFKILHTFGAAGDGVGPSSGVIFDKQGNAYGETAGGGDTSCEGGCGTVYELSPQKGGSWSETILYSFGPNSSGNPINPFGGLAMDQFGNLFGVTEMGGANDRGAAFELSPGANGWTEATLYNFCSLPNCADGGTPVHGPVLGPKGNLYGTDSGYPGVTYELSPGTNGLDGDGPLHLL